ncbi:MAG TPA: hypothetical protein VJ464_00790 [Blastocatellia bacterium]|nr:hypothetical protein [Blastocatellia bacterium]
MAKRLLLILLSLAMAAGLAPLVSWQAQAAGSANPLVARAVSAAVAVQGTATVIIPEPFTVAPNQPVPEPRSTVGIINALCEVTLNFVGCTIIPGSINIVCDTNADGVPELMIPLKDVTIVNSLLVRATLPALGPALPGTPFPLACCGGKANVVFSQTITAGDDNIFGTYTITQTVAIDLGLRAPVVISTSPSSLDCAVPQNLIVPGSCFLLSDGKPNVTAVFAVERGNPANVVQSKAFVIVNTSVIDALFDFGAANAGKTFLIYATGPNGTSRNLTALPQGTPTPCPLGNEQGVQVTVTCKTASGGGDPGSIPLADRCELQRDTAGAFSLLITGGKYPANSTMTIGGIAPKKVKMQGLDAVAGTYQSIIAKKKFCNGLPGNVVITDSAGKPVTAFFCNQSCAP